MFYEIKSIFGNKLTWLILFIFLLLGMRGTINFQSNVASNQNQETVQRSLAYKINSLEQIIAQETKSFEVQCTTKEEINWTQNWLAFRQWALEVRKEELRILKSYGMNSKDYQEFHKKRELIENICVTQMNVNTEDGYLPVEVYFSDQWSIYKEKLGIEELPFSIEEMTNYPFQTNVERERYNTTYGNSMLVLQYYFIVYDEDIALDYGTASPYAFLGYFYHFYPENSMIMGGLIFLFAVACMVEIRKSRSIQLLLLTPKKRWRKQMHYYLSILCSAFLILLFSIGVWILYWGIRYGFDGWNNPILVAENNFWGWKTNPNYYGAMVTGLARRYPDLKIRDSLGDYYVITYSEIMIPLWKYMFYTLILGICKTAFLCMLGFFLGMAGRKVGEILAGAMAIIVLYGFSQYTEQAMRWNPLAVSSAWTVTQGAGVGMTWMNAVVILVVSMAICWCILCVINRIRDEA